MKSGKNKRGQIGSLAVSGTWLLLALSALLNYGCAGLVSQTAQKQPGTQSPTVSITSPAAGTTVTGTVSVTANASSTIGIASVQFQVDGANNGAADTTSP